MNEFSSKHKKDSEKIESRIFNQKGNLNRRPDNRKVQIIHAHFN